MDPFLIQNELRNTLDRSLQLAATFERMYAEIYETSPRPEAQARLMQMNKNITKLKETLVKKKPVARNYRTSKTQSPNQLNKLEALVGKQETTEISKVSPTLDKPYEHKLESMIREANHRLLLTKSGKRTTRDIVNEEMRRPPMLRSLARSTSPDVTMNSSFASTSILANEGTGKYSPYISGVTGKAEDPYVPPTFEEYCASYDFEVKPGPTKEKAMAQINQTCRRINRFKSDMNELNEYLTANPHIQVGKDLKNIRRIAKHENSVRIEQANRTSQRRPTLVISQNHIAKDSSHRRTSSHAAPIKHVKDPSKTFAKVSADFKKAKTTQDQRLDQIMQSLADVRPFAMHSKLKLVMDDNERFRDSQYSLKKFKEYKMETEKQRGLRSLESRKQKVIYEAMLNWMKAQHREPIESERLLLELVRSTLAGSFVITKPDLFMMLSIFRGCTDQGVTELMQVIASYIGVDAGEISDALLR